MYCTKCGDSDTFSVTCNTPDSVHLSHASLFHIHFILLSPSSEVTLRETPNFRKNKTKQNKTGQFRRMCVKVTTGLTLKSQVRRHSSCTKQEMVYGLWDLFHELHTCNASDMPTLISIKSITVINVSKNASKVSFMLLSNDAQRSRTPGIKNPTQNSYKLFVDFFSMGNLSWVSGDKVLSWAYTVKFLDWSWHDHWSNTIF